MAGISPRACPGTRSACRRQPRRPHRRPPDWPAAHLAGLGTHEARYYSYYYDELLLLRTTVTITRAIEPYRGRRPGGRNVLSSCSKLMRETKCRLMMLPKVTQCVCVCVCVPAYLACLLQCLLHLMPVYNYNIMCLKCVGLSEQMAVQCDVSLHERCVGWQGMAWHLWCDMPCHGMACRSRSQRVGV